MLSDDRPTDPAWLPIFSKKEHFMGNAFGMIPGLEPDEWSNDACRGYVIMAMEDCGFSKKDLRFLFSQKVIRALLLPDELLHIFNFLGGWTSRQRCQRGVMVLAADARALVQNRHHAGVLLGTDGTTKTLP